MRKSKLFHMPIAYVFGFHSNAQYLIRYRPDGGDGR